MSLSGDQMELGEDEIRAHYEAALGLLTGFDHSPRLAEARAAAAPERSSGLGSRRRFRSTTPGLAARQTVRAEGVRLLDRIEGSDGEDALVSPRQATVMQGLRRALAIAMALGDAFGRTTDLAQMKRANLEGRLPAGDRTGFSELLAGEALVALYGFANAAAFLLADAAGEVTVEVGAVEEILTDNAPLALDRKSVV